ncbi:MAG: SDR family oxidoreductase [Bacteroidota bacterium]
MNTKIALVTGSNRGIGFAVVKGLLERGYKTILTSRKETDGHKAIGELAGFEESIYYHQLDVDEADSISAIVNYVEEEFGQLDILINNAGINYDTWQNAENADLDNVAQTINTNLFGPWRLSQEFLPLMKKKGYGRIVNVSSGAGAFEGMGASTPGYSVSKVALNAFTVKLGLTLQGTGVLVNAVCPGWVRTDMGGANADRSPEEGAETIIWLAELPDDGPTAKFFRDKKVIPF